MADHAARERRPTASDGSQDAAGRAQAASAAAAALVGAERLRLPLPQRGVEIAALDWGGDGPLALLHHANGFCAATLALVAAPLSRHFRVVAMDARGHGDSSRPPGDAAYAWSEFADDACAVAERLLADTRNERVALGLGHSFGGTALLTAAGRRPELFERLLAVDPVLHPPLPPGTSVSSRGAELVEGALRRRRRFASRAEARERFTGRSTFARWDPRALELYLADGLRDAGDGVELKCAPEVEAAVFGGGAGSRMLFEVASAVRARALLLWARYGDFPRRVYEAVVAEMPDARVEPVDSGHFVPMERPEAVLEAALRLVGLDGRSAAG